MRMRPEAERRMRAGFQRRVDEQAERYAPRLAHAERLASYSECGDVTGVFTERCIRGLAANAARPLFLLVLLQGPDLREVIRCSRVSRVQSQCFFKLSLRFIEAPDFYQCQTKV